MSENGFPEGLVTRTELAELAVLFDQFEFAFDPRSPVAKEAESEFENRVRRIFDEKVISAHPRLSFPLFYCKLKSVCRTFLRKNLPS
jgi:hypothetical protein